MNEIQPLPASRWLDSQTPPHLMTLVAMAALSALSMNIFLTSIPSMAEYFGADYAVMQLAVPGYMAASAVLQLIIGPLSDLYGRRPVMLLGTSIFVIASVGCIFATSVEVFLAFRLLQGSIVTAMVLSRAIVRDIHGPAEAARMLSFVTMGMAVVPMIGPMVGGVLEELFNWQASFWTLAAFGVGLLLLVWRDLGETHRYRGAGFASQFRAYPELVRSPRFWGYTLTAGFASGAYFAFLGGAPFVAASILNISPTEMGLYFIIITSGYIVGNYFSARNSNRLGLNQTMLAGCIVSVGGTVVVLALYALGFHSPIALFGPMVLVGLGNGLTMPNANTGMVSVRPQLAGSASGLGGAMMVAVGASMSAITGALLGPGSSAYPLILMMMLSASASIFSALLVIRVARKKGALDPQVL